MRISIVIDTGDDGPTVSVHDGGVGSGPGEGESSGSKRARENAGSFDGGSAPQVPAGFAEPATFTSPPPPVPIVGQPGADRILGKAGVDPGVDPAVGYPGGGEAPSGSGEDAAISAGAAPTMAAEQDMPPAAEEESGTRGEGGESAGASPARTAAVKRTRPTAKRGSRSKG